MRPYNLRHGDDWLTRMDESSRRIVILFAVVHESAIGPKHTRPSALHMSAYGGKADMTLCGNPLLRSLLGVKRTSLFAAQMSAYDPKRTS
jgi:hypothetical protein